MSELTIEQRVAAGVAYLDENHPGWMSRVFAESLDLSSCTLCVLGQVFGDYCDAPREAKFASDSTTQAGRDRGFEIPYGTTDYQGEYAALTAEWRRVIESRRAES